MVLLAMVNLLLLLVGFLPHLCKQKKSAATDQRRGNLTFGQFNESQKG
jgi:hypothetical protein